MGAIKLSKLTEKYQATVPDEIRKVLKLTKGDHITFEIMKDQTVVLRKATQVDLDWAHAIQDTLSEWASPQDERAYRDL